MRQPDSSREPSKSWVARSCLVAVPLAGTLLSLFAAPAVAAPRNPRVYLGAEPGRVTIAWNSNQEEATTVRYGLAAGSYGDLAHGSSFAAADPIGFVHEVELAGLRADTTYYYQVGDGNPPGIEASFRTGPKHSSECGSFRFAVSSDSQAEFFQDPGASWRWPVILEEIAAENVAFVLSAGDLVATGRDANMWRQWLGDVDPLQAGLPIMPVLGNHDIGPGQGDGAHWNQIFALPRSGQALGGSGTEDYYFFTYGNAIFVGLSTETYRDGTPSFAEQAEWLDNVLTGNPRRWRIVWLHAPIYTASYWPLQPPNEYGQNEALVPVLTKHHVDIVFQGHNHWYERFHPSACKDGSSQPCVVPSFAEGTVFITTGTGGGQTTPCNLMPPDSLVVCDMRYGYSVVEIRDGHLELRAMASSAQQEIVSQAFRAQVDQLTIDKLAPSPDPCATGPADGGGDGRTQPDAAPGEGGVGDRVTRDGGAGEAGGGSDGRSGDGRSGDGRSGDGAGGGERGAAGDGEGGGLPGGCGCRVAKPSTSASGLACSLLPLVLVLLLARTGGGGGRRWRVWGPRRRWAPSSGRWRRSGQCGRRDRR